VTGVVSTPFGHAERVTDDPIRTLAAVRSVAARRTELRPTTPAELAARLIPGYTVTPTLKLLSDVLADAITGPKRRVIISTPPRTGKSVLVSQIGPCSR
jgi:hypothetical protein